MEFINDNVGYLKGTHVGICHENVNGLILHFEAAWPPVMPNIISEKYLCLEAGSRGHVRGWHLNFSNSELVRLAVLFE